MFKANRDIMQKDESAIGKYLMRLGMELSDLVELNGISVVRSDFWGRTGSFDIHGIYSLADSSINKIIHVQACTALTQDRSNPLIWASLRVAPELFNDKDARADNTEIIKELFPQNTYGKDPGVVAGIIAKGYNEYMGIAGNKWW